MVKPTEARAMAPEVMLARGVSWGRLDEEAVVAIACCWPGAGEEEEEAWSFVPRSCFARDVRKAFNVLK